MVAITINDGEKFFCPLCKLHITFCQCPEYADRGHKGRLADYKVRQRRKLKEECRDLLLKQLNPH